MNFNIEATRSTLERLRGDVERLKKLPLSNLCTTATEVLERMAKQMALELDVQEQPFVLYSTRTHAWLRVPIVEVQRLKLVDRISRFSYLSATHYYLEASSDMRSFLSARTKEGRFVTDYLKETLPRFPMSSDIKRLDTLPGYVSMA